VISSIKEAALVRLFMTDSIQSELNVAVFIFESDTFGLSAIAQMRTLARRGVKVRLLLDATIHKISPQMVEYLVREGVEIRVYHPFNFRRLSWINRRMHDKLVIADKQRLMVGSRNFGNGYFFRRKLKTKPLRDIELYLEGQAAADSNEYFMKMWDSGEVRTPKRINLTGRQLRTMQHTLDRYETLINKYRVSHVAAFEEFQAGLKDYGPIRFAHDVVGAKGIGLGVEAELITAIRNSRYEVLIESPYLILTKRMENAMMDAISNGAVIRIVTNSHISKDQELVWSRYNAERKRLQDMGIQIFEYTKPETLHGKAVVVDKRLSFIGTYNLDPRSQDLNTEVITAGRSRAEAEDLHKIIMEHMADSVPAGELKLSLAERCGYRLKAVVSRIIRSSL